MDYLDKSKEELIAELEILKNDLISLKSLCSVQQTEIQNIKANYNNLINLGVDGILLGSNSGIITDANDCFCKMTGYNRNELIGKHISKDLFTKESLDNVPFRFDLLQKGEIVVSERTIKRADMSEIVIEMRTKMLPDKTFQSTFRDITLRKQSEIDLKEKNNQIEIQNDEFRQLNEQLHLTIDELTILKEKIFESEKKYKALVETTSDFIWETNMDGIYTYVSPQVERLIGYTPEEIIGQSPFEYTPESEKSEIFKISEDIVKNKTSFNSFVISVLHKNQDIKYIETSGVPVFNKNGELTHYRGISRDITERKTSEIKLIEINNHIESQNEELIQINKELLDAKEKLRESEEKYRIVFETSPDVININKLDGTYVDVNEGFTLLTGYTRDEVIGANHSQINTWVNPEDRENLINTIKQNGFIRNLETLFRLKNGTQLTGLISSKLIFLNNEPHILSISRNITERKQAELQLQEKNSQIEMQNEEYKQLNEELTLLTNELKNAQIKLLESEERYKNIIKILPDGVVIHTGGKIVFANQVACNIMKAKSIDQMIGLSAINFVHPDYREVALERINQSFQKKETAEAIEEIFITLEGEKIYVIVSAVPFYNLGNPSMLTVFTDISERKKAELQILEKNNQIEAQNEEYKQLNEELYIAKEKAEEHLLKNNALLLTIPDLIFVLNKQGVFLEYYSAKVENLLIEPHYFINESIHKVLPKEIADITSEKIKEVLQHKKFANYEYSLLSNSEIQYFEARMVYIDDNRILAIIRDITDRKKIMSELIISKEKAEESDRLKSAFLANMSHEIRTPMNGILGFAQLLSNQDLTLKQIEKYTEIINNSGQQLLTIIDDLIDISKIESNQIKIDVQPISLNGILLDIYYLLKQKAISLNLELKYSFELSDESILILSDGNRLRQILINLISNSFKFTKEGYILFGYEIKNEMIEFFIVDTGKGIPQEMHSRIFDRFVQVETELSKLTGGTGLGLSISKSLIELLGGKIWLKSDSGKGTTFYFTIPYKKFEEKIIIKKPVLPQIINDEKKHTILVAEDEEANFVFLEILLKNMFKNAIILHARNGQEAINSVIQFPEISLILMDLKMPEMNGYTATIEIKKINPDIIIIAQTAYALSSDELKAKEVGCDNYIPKPINKNNLFELLSKYLY